MFLSFVPSADGKHKDLVVRFGQRSLTWLLVASVLTLSIAPVLWDALLIPLVTKHLNAERRVYVEMAASRGNRDAQLWLGMNFPQDKYRVQKLADEGYADAIYVLARRAARSDPAKSGELMARAARAGSVVAIKTQMERGDEALHR
jgi:hypothetical protein